MEKMSVHANVRMSKIMCTSIKVGKRTYATYANCRPLQCLTEFSGDFTELFMITMHGSA